MFIPKWFTLNVFVAFILIVVVMAPPTNDVFGNPEGEKELLIYIDELQTEQKREKIKNFIEQPGNILTIYGVIKDRMPIYNALYQDRKMPMMLTKDEAKKHEDALKKGKTPVLPENRMPEAPKRLGGIEQVEMKSVLTTLSFYNHAGEIFTQSTLVAMPLSMDERQVVDNLTVEKQVKSAIAKKERSAFKAYVKNLRQKYPKGEKGRIQTDAGTVEPATIIHFARESTTFFATQPKSGKTKVIGKTVVDHIAYQVQESDPKYDYITVKDHVQVWSGAAAIRNSDGELCSCNVGAYLGTLDNYYMEDNLLDWEPDYQTTLQAISKT